MKSNILAIATLTVAFLHGSLEMQSPKQVVEEYWKMETSGGRLTPEGWKAADKYEMRAISYPSKKTIVVVADDWSVWEPRIKGNSAEVIVGVRRIGTIGPTLAYEKTNSDAIKEGILHRLIQSDRYWSVAGTEQHGPMSWRLEKTGEVIWLSVNAAIAYSEEVRSRADDPAIKQNAAKTVAILKRYMSKKTR